MTKSTCLHIQDHESGPIRVVELPWISVRIGRAAHCEVRLIEIFVDAFGQDEGLKVRAEGDPQVVKALELLPQAKQLEEDAKRQVAMRTSNQPLSR